jgi:hypothetical protein
MEKEMKTRSKKMAESILDKKTIEVKIPIMKNSL